MIHFFIEKHDLVRYMHIKVMCRDMYTKQLIQNRNGKYFTDKNSNRTKMSYTFLEMTIRGNILIFEFNYKRTFIYRSKKLFNFSLRRRELFNIYSSTKGICPLSLDFGDF